MEKTVAIIGAGMAGLAAARTLRMRHPQFGITVYEKSRGFGGRVATRRRDAFIFDHGAQCIRGPSAAVEQLLCNELDASQLRTVDAPIWTFDAAGTISEGDAQHNALPTYAYADGNNRLGKLLAEGIEVKRETRIGQIRPINTQWQLIDTNGADVGTADAVLFTAPGPQTREIIQASELEPELARSLDTALLANRYRRCLSLALAYDTQIARPFYALVNSDRQHALVWLGLEHNKAAERCPAGTSLLIAQMAPAWSNDHYDLPAEQLAPEIITMIAALLGEDPGVPLWFDLHRWRYALPETAAHFTTTNALGAAAGLFFAGDSFDQQGRVHLAIERGWQAAELIDSYLVG